MIELRTLGALAAMTLAALAASSVEAAPYVTMAPLAQYMFADREAEIAVARSAAPPAISREATILVLGAHGYETAAKGANGFVCLVERSWMSPFDQVTFWDPRIRGPVCYNPPAARSVLSYTLRRTQMALSGWSKQRMLEALDAEAARNSLAPPEAGAMSYMLSPQQRIGDSAQPWKPHMMFHLPRTTAAAWGANLPGSPIMVDTAHGEVPEPQTIFMMAADTWSDGTPAPAAHDPKKARRPLKHAAALTEPAFHCESPLLAGP